MAVADTPDNPKSRVTSKLLEQRTERAAKLAIPFATVCAFGYLSAFFCVSADDLPLRVALLSAFAVAALCAVYAVASEYIRVAEPELLRSKTEEPLKVFKGVTQICAASLMAVIAVLSITVMVDGYYAGKNSWKEAIGEIKEATKTLDDSLHRLQTCRENRDAELRSFDASAPTSKLSKSSLASMRKAIRQRCADHDENLKTAFEKYKQTARDAGFDPDAPPAKDGQPP